MLVIGSVVWSSTLEIVGNQKVPPSICIKIRFTFTSFLSFIVKTLNLFELFVFYWITSLPEVNSSPSSFFNVKK